MPILPGAILIAFGISVLFFVLLRRQPKSTSTVPADAQWLTGFSVARYRPMQRLLTDEDYEFLRRQPGFQPAIARRLRADRRRIFRAYLRNMRRDFNRLHRIATFMVIYGTQERPELISALGRHQRSFRMAYATVQLRLALHVIAGASVDVAPLIRALDGMRVQLNPAEAAA